MTQKGLLVSEGYGKGTRYILPINGIDVLREEPSNVESLDPNVESLDPNVESFDPNVESLDPNVESLNPNVESLDPNVGR